MVYIMYVRWELSANRSQGAGWMWLCRRATWRDRAGSAAASRGNSTATAGAAAAVVDQATGGLMLVDHHTLPGTSAESGSKRWPQEMKKTKESMKTSAEQESAPEERRVRRERRSAENADAQEWEGSGKGGEHKWNGDEAAAEEGKGARAKAKWKIKPTKQGRGRVSAQKGRNTKETVKPPKNQVRWTRGEQRVEKWSRKKHKWEMPPLWERGAWSKQRSNNKTTEKIKEKQETPTRLTQERHEVRNLEWVTRASTRIEKESRSKKKYKRHQTTLLGRSKRAKYNTIGEV